MSKYIKLSESILRMKLEKLISDEMPEAINQNIREILASYDHEKAATLASEAEKTKSELAKKKEVPKVVEKEESYADKEKEFTKILSDAEFRAIKDSFGILKKDENDIPFYSSLSDQFIDIMSKNQSLRFLRAKYYDFPVFDESMEFRFVNTNIGTAKSFEGYEKYFFICFRLFVDPETNVCTYESLWIVNTSDSLETVVIPSDYPYFTWEEISDSDRVNFVREFLKISVDDPSYKSEAYFR